MSALTLEELGLPPAAVPVNFRKESDLPLAIAGPSVDGNPLADTPEEQARDLASYNARQKTERRPTLSTVAGPPPVAQVSESAGYKSMSLEELGLPVAAPKPEAKPAKQEGWKKWIGEAAAVGDIVAGFPAMATGFIMNLGVTAATALQGKPREEAWQAGRDIQEGVMQGGPLAGWQSSPFGHALELLNNKGAYEGATVNEIQKQIGGKLEAGADWVEKQSGGSIPKNAVMTLFDGLMIGGAAVGGRIMKGVKGEAKVGEAPPVAERVEPTMEKPATPDVPPDSTPHTPETMAKAHVDGRYADPTLAGKAARKYWRDSDKEARQAFPDDKDYAAYVKAKSEARVNRKEGAPEPAEPEPTQAPPATTSEAIARFKAEMTGDIPEVSEGDAHRLYMIPKVNRTALERMQLKRYEDSLRQEKGPAPIEEAAFRHKASGQILRQGKEHSDQLKALPFMEPGFVDVDGEFHTRASALERAQQTGQFPKGAEPTEPGAIHSQDLWPKEPRPEPIPKGDGSVEVAPGQRVMADPKMRGSIGVKEVATLAAGVVGATLGKDYDPEHPIIGAILGALGGVVGIKAVPGAATVAWDVAKGAILGPGGVRGKLTAAVESGISHLPEPLKSGLSKDTRIRATEEMNTRDEIIAREEQVRSQVKSEVLQAAPDKLARGRISHYLEGDTSVQLKPSEMTAAGKVRDWFERMADLGMKQGVLEGTLSNYVSHIFGKEQAGWMEQFFAERAGTGATSTRFAQQRTGPPTIREVNEWLAKKAATEGKEIKPITDDIAVIMEQYGRSLVHAVANKSVLDALKVREVPMMIGNKAVKMPLVMNAGAKNLPRDYVKFGKEGMRAHPDIVQDLRFLFDQDTPAGLMRGIESLWTTTKRMAVSFSGFHAGTLLQVFTGAAKLQKRYPIGGAIAGGAYALAMDKPDPITYAMMAAGFAGLIPGLRIIGQAAKPNKLLAPAIGATVGYLAAPDDSKAAGLGIGLAAGLAPRFAKDNPYAKAMQHAADADPQMVELVDRLIQKGGLKVTFPKGDLAVEDVNNSFYNGLTAAQKFMDSVVPKSGKLAEGFIQLNHHVDAFMWERLHTMYKLQVSMEKYQALLENNVKAHAADPKVPLKSLDAIAAEAASFTDTVFGGLNWRRAAEDAQTRFGRDVMKQVYSPKGRRVLQLVDFAPDWLVSTTRAATQAMREGTGWKGVMNERTVADLHRQYLLRSAMYYVMIADGLNVAFTGNHLWNNTDKSGKADPWHVYTGDGRRINVAKHFIDPVELALEPGKTLYGKLPAVPKEAINQAMGTDYTTYRPDKSPHIGGPPMKMNPALHAAKTMFSPITFGNDAQAGALSSMGVLMYGRKDSEVAAEKAAAKTQKQLDRLAPSSDKQLKQLEKELKRLQGLPQ